MILLFLSPFSFLKSKAQLCIATYFVHISAVNSSHIQMM